MIFAWPFVVMLISTCLFFTWFLYRPIKPGLSDDDSNIAINKQRHEELEADINQGLIDDNQYQIAESEIINTLANELEDSNKDSIVIKPMTWSIATFLFLSVLSIAIYSQLSPKMPPNEQALIEPLSMNDSIKQLQIFLEENPDDFQALKMMGLAQIGIGNVNESIEAFKSAYLINPVDVDLLLQYASAIAASQDGKFDGKPKVLINEAFFLDPQSIQVLYFLGIVAAYEGNLNDAINYWEKALYLMQLNDPERSIIEEALDTVMNLQVK